MTAASASFLLAALLAAAPAAASVKPPAPAEVKPDPKPKPGAEPVEARVYRRTAQGWEEVADPNDLKKGDLVLLFLKNAAGKWDVRPARIAADVTGGKVEFEEAPFPGSPEGEKK